MSGSVGSCDGELGSADRDRMGICSRWWDGDESGWRWGWGWAIDKVGESIVADREADGPSDAGDWGTGDIGVGDTIPVSLRGVIGSTSVRVSAAPATEAREDILSLCPEIVNAAMCAVKP